MNLSKVLCNFLVFINFSDKDRVFVVFKISFMKTINFSFQ